MAPPNHASISRKAPGCYTAGVESDARSTRTARFGRGPQRRKKSDPPSSSVRKAQQRMSRSPEKVSIVDTRRELKENTV